MSCHFQVYPQIPSYNNGDVFGNSGKDQTIRHLFSRSIIEPYTDHFFHEIYCFAVSQHNTLNAYDSATLYVRMEETQVQTSRHLQPIPNNRIPAPPPPHSCLVV